MFILSPIRLTDGTHLSQWYNSFGSFLIGKKELIATNSTIIFMVIAINRTLKGSLLGHLKATGTRVIHGNDSHEGPTGQ